MNGDSLRTSSGEGDDNYKPEALLVVVPSCDEATCSKIVVDELAGTKFTETCAFVLAPCSFLRFC